MKILTRYSEAVNSDNLKSEPNTTYSDTDVLGAAGLAAKWSPLGAALVRLFADGKPESCVCILTHMTFKRARTKNIHASRFDCANLARAVLAWHRFGTCKPCGGTGYRIIPGTPSLGDQCPSCHGTGKMPFDSQFAPEVLELARWASAEIDRAQAAFGGDAMAMIAPKLNF